MVVDEIIDDNKKLLLLACVLIVVGISLCSYSLLTNTNSVVENKTISYQGIVITIASNNIEVLKNNDEIFEIIDHDNNTKYTYEVWSGDDSGTVAQGLVVGHHGVAFDIGNGNYIVGYATQLEGNDDENFNGTSLILKATNGTLIDFFDLVNKVNSNV